MGSHIGVTALLILALLAGTALAQDSSGLIVKEIVFEGNVRSDESTLEYLIKTKEGRQLSQLALAEDVSTLLRFFESVTTVEEPVPGGVRIIFRVKEYPVVTQVLFRGFEDVSDFDTKMKPNVNTKKGFSYAEYTVQLDRGRLEEWLQKQGYYFAEVSAAQGAYQGGRRVVFSAITGPLVEVDEIRFTGNETIEGGDLEDWMLTRESGFFQKGPFVRKTLDQDLISLANQYRSEGFLDVLVELKDLTFTADKEEVTITIGIAENQPYLVEEIVIEGAEEFPEDHEELRKRMELKPGDRRRETDLIRDRESLRAFYQENAFYNVRIRYATFDDATTKTSRVVFQILEGEPVRVRRIDISGNVVTKDQVIRRNLSVHPGGPMNSIEIAKSRARLDATTFFEQGSVQTTVKDTDDPGWKDLEISLREGKTGSLKFSAGLTSDLGIMGMIEFKKRNFDWKDVPEGIGDFFDGTAFTGGGQTLELLLQPGSSSSQYRLRFVEPWFWEEYIFYGPADEVEESPFSFGIDLFSTLFSRFDYDSRRTGVSLSLGKTWRDPGREIDDVYGAKLYFRLENVRIDDLSSSAPPNAYVLEGSNREQRVGLGLSWNHVDIPAAPGKGFEADLRYDMAGGPFGGEINYHKVEGGITQYITLGMTKDKRRHILELRGRVGWSKPFDDTDEVPIFDRFFAGGRETVRGFAYGQVGPRAEGNPNTNKGRRRIRNSLEDGDGDPTGGEAMWLARAQYSFPIYDTLLRGVVFTDAGNVADNWNDDLHEKYRASIGAGVRIRISQIFGPTPIALDFAVPVRDEKGDDHQIISFSFDRPF